MAFDEEWRQLVAGAKDRQVAGTQLNSAHAGPGADGPSGGDLVVQQDDLGAVGNEAYTLHGGLHKKADIAGSGADKDGAGSTARAARELSQRSFTSGDALTLALDVWGSQVKTVLQMCAHISNHLDYSKKAHAKDEAEIAASFKHRDGSAVSVSELSKYVK
jgi:hypothetical protein